MTAFGEAFGRWETAHGLLPTRARGLLAGILILLMALSGLTGAVARIAAPGLSAHVFCLDGTGSSKETGKVRHDAACCILCVDDGDERAPPRETRATTVSRILVPLTGATSAHIVAGGGRHIGWLSAWSSRAPPAFS
jgi:hypothetical protein